MSGNKRQRTHNYELSQEKRDHINARRRELYFLKKATTKAPKNGILKQIYPPFANSALDAVAGIYEIGIHTISFSQ